MLDLDDALGVLVHGEGVDDAYGVALLEPFELGDDLAVELGLLEPRTINCTGPMAMSRPLVAYQGTVAPAADVHIARIG